MSFLKSNFWVLLVIFLFFIVLFIKFNLKKVAKSGFVPRTKHFSIMEFHSKDGVKVPERYYSNLQKLMANLEVIRKHLGNSTIRINSGYRSPSHNSRVGGAKKSYHLRAMAADIRISGYSPSGVYHVIKRLIREGKIHAGGLGRYNTFVHYDVGPNRYWDKRR